MKKLIARILILSCIVILIGLGIWQLKRMEYKNNLIHQLEETLALPTEMMSDFDILTKSYRKVKVCGNYIHSKDMFVYYKPDYIILTPFHIKNINQTIVVARGILKPKQQNISATNDNICITGMLIPSEKKPLFMPETNGTKSKPLLSINIETISSIISTELPDMYLLHIPDPKENKKGLEPIKIPNPKGIYNPHIGYAITWFTLAFIVIFMGLITWKNKK